MGTPYPSTSMLLFVPDFALSVGLGPVLFPPERCLGHRGVHRLPLPLDPLHLIIVQEALSPHLSEDSCLPPLLEPVMDGALPSQ